MSINQDIKTLGKDLTNEAKGAGDAAVDQAKTAIATAKTPFYAVIGASDHAAKRAAAIRPDSVREAVREVVTEAVATAAKALRRYEKRGQMVVADLRRAPGFTRILKGAESAVDRVEDALEGLISDAQGELKGVRQTAGSTASKAKATVRKASTRRTAARKPGGSGATAGKSGASTTTAAKATAKRAPANNATSRKASTRKASTRKASTRKASTSKATTSKATSRKASTRSKATAGN